MPRQRTGSIKIRDGRIYARVTYIDEFGKRHDLTRRAETKTEAKEIIKKLLRELDDHGSSLIQSEHMTFNKLAEYYQTHYLIPPIYVEDRKVSGLRGHYEQKLLLTTLKDFFGARQVRRITHGDLKKFKATRLKTPTRADKQRSIASVNRELALLSKIFNVAKAEGWLIKNPFESGNSLISLADEKKRERILTLAEEAKLLAACVGTRAHLYPIILIAVDCGLRQGELLKLQWKDVDFTNRLLNIQALNTKTLTNRQVAMTTRVINALQKIYNSKKTIIGADLVFGITDNVKHSFASVRTLADLTDLRFHDLRHTCATRLISQGIPLTEVSRILGHTQPRTTFRYVNLTVETAHKVAEAMEQFHLKGEKEPILTAKE